MKIVLNCTYNSLANDFIPLEVDVDKNEIISTKSERGIFDEIEKESADAYILENYNSWTQKAIDFIKKKSPHIPIIILMIKEIDGDKWPRGGDFYLFNPEYIVGGKEIYESVSRTLESYQEKFGKLQKLTAKMKEEIEFGSFKYDPVRKNLRYNDKLVKKMSPKEGGVLEILAANFGNVVKKEIIMERVWHNVDFYVGRSMDVYVTNLRNLFKTMNIPLTIKNIHNVGLIMENDEKI